MTSGFARLNSPLAGGPVDLHVRVEGRGPPAVILHGGWGYGYYPFDALVAALSPFRTVLAPDRTGYGQSGGAPSARVDFHDLAVGETRALFDALDVERALLVGASDGAVIAAKMALAHPDRVEAIVLEAFHLLGAKPASRAFFATAAEDPRAFGGRVEARLRAEHGERWEALLRAHGRAWLALAERGGDLYGGALAKVACPVLLVHGDDDPRTEPGELDRVRAALPRSELLLVRGGGHAPHASKAAEVAAAVAAFARRAR